MAQDASFDVTGLGNAIVDVIAHVDDAFLATHGIEKGGMTLIDEARATELYAAMPPAREVSGGSAANTLVGVASFGAKGAYLGKVADDQLGAVFAHDIRAGGVAYDTQPLVGGPATARCLILVTPDAQRSMNTFLGASTLFGPSDIDAERIRASRILYLEGYLFDRDDAQNAFKAASQIAKDAGRQVALTLSDGFCVDRHRESFRDLVRGNTDILFANESEVIALYEAKSFDEALQAIRADKARAFLTRSEHGSVVVDQDEVHVIDAAPVEDRVVDSTGAGDQYAAGVLAGLSKGLSPADAAQLGSIAAAEVISHLGGRPERSLKALASEAGMVIEA